jgi:hypothetical protein
MNKKHLFLAFNSFYVIVLFSIGSLLGCSTDNDDKENYCGLLSYQTTMRADQPSLKLSCIKSTDQISDIQYDQYSRIIECQRNITCDSKSYSVWFSNIVYNDLGQIQSYDATINGQNCHYTRH